MSNNRNRNRNRNRSQSNQQETAVQQDRVFIFNSRTGAEIRIPASIVFDPDAACAIEISDAQNEGNELGQMAAMLRFIQSGFPEEIADTIDIKLSELEDFTRAFMKFFGVSIPK